MKIIVGVFTVRTLNYSHEYLQSGRAVECSNILFNSKRFCLKVEGGLRKLSTQETEGRGRGELVISCDITQHSRWRYPLPLPVIAIIPPGEDYLTSQHYYQYF